MSTGSESSPFAYWFHRHLGQLTRNDQALFNILSKASDCDKGSSYSVLFFSKGMVYLDAWKSSNTTPALSDKKYWFWKQRILCNQIDALQEIKAVTRAVKQIPHCVLALIMFCSEIDWVHDWELDVHMSACQVYRGWIAVCETCQMNMPHLTERCVEILSVLRDAVASSNKMKFIDAQAGLAWFIEDKFTVMIRRFTEGERSPSPLIRPPKLLYNVNLANKSFVEADLLLTIFFSFSRRMLEDKEIEVLCPETLGDIASLSIEECASHLKQDGKKYEAWKFLLQSGVSVWNLLKASKFTALRSRFCVMFHVCVIKIFGSRAGLLLAATLQDHIRDFRHEQFAFYNNLLHCSALDLENQILPFPTLQEEVWTFIKSFLDRGNMNACDSACYSHTLYNLFAGLIVNHTQAGNYEEALSFYLKWQALSCGLRWNDAQSLGWQEYVSKERDVLFLAYIPSLFNAESGLIFRWYCKWGSKPHFSSKVVDESCYAGMSLSAGVKLDKISAGRNDSVYDIMDCLRIMSLSDEAEESKFGITLLSEILIPTMERSANSLCLVVAPHLSGIPWLALQSSDTELLDLYEGGTFLCPCPSFFLRKIKCAPTALFLSPDFPEKIDGEGLSDLKESKNMLRERKREYNLRWHVPNPESLTPHGFAENLKMARQNRYRIVEILTHGLQDYQIVTCLRDNVDPKISLSDIGPWPFDLVALPVCHTGEQRFGKQIGMCYEALIQGAISVISSCTSTNSNCDAFLHVFYSEWLLQKKPKAVAARLAALSVREGCICKKHDYAHLNLWGSPE